MSQFETQVRAVKPVNGEQRRRVLASTLAAMPVRVPIDPWLVVKFPVDIRGKAVYRKTVET